MGDLGAVERPSGEGATPDHTEVVTAPESVLGFRERHSVASSDAERLRSDHPAGCAIGEVDASCGSDLTILGLDDPRATTKSPADRTSEDRLSFPPGR